ncbi:S-crystallin 4-like [Antedon mediterranea]|uniref:S-crystallin 4-like n=1 Tax=Antedon mediterranea TaxID=105859 RepID=UPI003AF56714
MSKFTLTYFDARGRAENARLLFVVAGVKYEDKRLEMSAWGENKASMPFGVLPNLKLADGTSVAMSAAIANYLAREFNLYGKGNKENAQVDTVTNALSEIMDLVYKFIFTKEEGPKAEAKTKASAKIASYGAALEENLKQNNGGKGYLVGKSITLADIAFFNAFSEIAAMDDKALDNLPLLKALLARVGTDKKIAKWVETRPKTQF